MINFWQPLLEKISTSFIGTLIQFTNWIWTCCLEIMALGIKFPRIWKHQKPHTQWCGSQNPWLVAHNKNIELLLMMCLIRLKKVTFSFLQKRKKKHCCPTLSNSEIICGQNVGTKVVCGMILFLGKKAMLKIWKKSWVPFRSYLLNSTANPAHLHLNWAGLAVLFSR